MADPLWDKAQTDPTYIAGHAGLRQAMIDAFLANGDTSMLTPELMQQYGISAQDVAGAGTNPYSQKAQLGLQLQRDQGGITQQANARGVQFSGAHAAAQAHEMIAANQRTYGSLESLRGTLGTIGQKNTDLITGAYRNLMGQAATDPTIPPPALPADASAAPVAPAAPAAPTPTIYGSGSGINAGQPAVPVSGQWGINPRAPQNQLGVAPKVIPPKVFVAPGLHGGNQ